MKNIRLSKFWDSLQSSYWFLPSIMALGGLLLAFGMLYLDQQENLITDQLGWIYAGGPDGARGLLAAVAGSMATVAATAFSITIVALQLAAANFGPRLLRNFMQDTGNQVVLGTFIATFVYSLSVLRTIRGQDYNLFVPQLSVTVGMVLAIASIGVLIFFIHHASTIIQASYVIASVADELDEAIDRLFPQQLGQSEADLRQPIGEIPGDFDRRTAPVSATSTGYLQMVDDEQLLKLAGRYHLLLRLMVKPGDFIIQGSPLVMVYPGEQVNQQLEDQLNRAFLLGRERTEQQDVGFPIDQLVEIALRALSPGINDPFTAIRCIDRLSAGLAQLAQRSIPSAYRYDEAQTLRVIAEPINFSSLVDSAFNQIRRYGASDIAVSLHLIEAISRITAYTNSYKYRFSLRQQVEMIMQSSYEHVTEEGDRQKLDEQYQRFLTTLETRKPSSYNSRLREFI